MNILVLCRLYSGTIGHNEHTSNIEVQLSLSLCTLYHRSWRILDSSNGYYYSTYIG